MIVSDDWWLTPLGSRGLAPEGEDLEVKAVLEPHLVHHSDQLHRDHVLPQIVPHLQCHASRHVHDREHHDIKDVEETFILILVQPSPEVAQPRYTDNQSVNDKRSAGHNSKRQVEAVVFSGARRLSP